ARHPVSPAVPCRRSGRGRATASLGELNMRLARRVGYAAALAALLGAGTALYGAGTAHAQTGSVSGTVTDESGAAVSGAEVREEGSGCTTSTDERGHSELRDGPRGPQTVRVLMLGYKPLVRQVTVGAGPAASLDMKLEKSVIPVAPIEVVVGSRARHTAAD